MLYNLKRSSATCKNSGFPEHTGKEQRGGKAQNKTATRKGSMKCHGTRKEIFKTCGWGILQAIIFSSLRKNANPRGNTSQGGISHPKLSVPKEKSKITRRKRDKETRRKRDKETRRKRDKGFWQQTHS